MSNEEIKQSVVARACIMVDGKLLVVKRGIEGEADDGYWELPGGMVEPGETPTDALVREIKEELSLSVTSIKPFRVSSVNWPFAAPANQTITIDFIAKLQPPQTINGIRLTNEHSEWKLVDEGELKTLEPLRELVADSLQAGFENK